MRTSRAVRTLAVLASAGMIVGAFAAVPAEAKKKKKKPAACSTFKPGAKGEGKPTLKVTDAATEQAPTIQTVTLPESIADADLVGTGVLTAGADAFNIQVDSAAKEAGLYILFEFPERRDYDLEMYHVDGSYAARSHDFNPVHNDQVPIWDNGGHAGESSPSSEKIVGVRTSDCGGFSVEAVNWLGEGGDFEIKVWLGEIKNDPLAPGTETP
jgi:hypothetical protein